MRGDEVEDRIGWLTSEKLIQVAIHPEYGAWEKLYRDLSDGRFWELTFPHGEMQGGGPKQLQFIPRDEAVDKYQVARFEFGRAPRTLRLRKAPLRALGSRFPLDRSRGPSSEGHLPESLLGRVELGLGDEVYAGPVGCSERTADGCGVDVLDRCTEACTAHGSFTEGEEEVERGIHGPLFAQESDPDVEGPMRIEPCMDGSCRHGGEGPRLPCPAQRTDHREKEEGRRWRPLFTSLGSTNP